MKYIKKFNESINSNDDIDFSEVSNIFEKFANKWNLDFRKIKGKSITEMDMRNYIILRVLNNRRDKNDNIISNDKFWDGGNGFHYDINSFKKYTTLEASIQKKSTGDDNRFISELKELSTKLKSLGYIGFIRHNDPERVYFSCFVTTEELNPFIKKLSKDCFVDPGSSMTGHRLFPMSDILSVF